MCVVHQTLSRVAQEGKQLPAQQQQQEARDSSFDTAPLVRQSLDFI